MTIVFLIANQCFLHIIAILENCKCFPVGGAKSALTASTKEYLSHQKTAFWVLF